jgi:hypothetical protein
MTPWCAVRIVGVTFSVLSGAATAAGQDPAAQPLSPVPRIQARMPLLTIGAGVGVDPTDETVPLQALSLQYHVRRNLILSGDLTHAPIEGQAFGYSLGKHEWAAAGELLYSTDPRRVTAFVGGGGGVFRRDEFAFEHFCSSGPCGPPTIMPRLMGSLHFTTGANVRVADPIHAFMSVRLTTTDLPVQFVGGVRVAVATRSVATSAGRFPKAATSNPADAVGREVRVTFTNGARLSQRLVALTDRDVEVERHGARSRYSIDDVQLIERTRHAARYGTVIGGLTGFVAGTMMCGGGDEQCDYPVIDGGVIVGAMGAGIGAAVGALINSTTASRHVLYARRTSTVTVVPAVTRGRAAVGVAFCWR